VYPHPVAWEGVGEDTVMSYSACLRKISQNASRKIKKKCLHLPTLFNNISGYWFVSGRFWNQLGHKTIANLPLVDDIVDSRPSQAQQAQPFLACNWLSREF
jgi:hypothetical protein